MMSSIPLETILSQFYHNEISPCVLYHAQSLTLQWQKLVSSFHRVFVSAEKESISIIRSITLSPRKVRLMTMSPLYPCGKSCSRGTHNEKVKNLALFSSIINGIMKESRLRISIPWECFQFFNRIETSITLTP